MKTRAILLMVSATFLVAATRETKRVEVDGRTYRVTVQGQGVIVANKGAVVTYDLDERDRQRKAVEAATGCRVSDEMPSADARLRGRLDCTTAPR